MSGDRLHAARAWLSEALASGPVPVAELQAAAAAAGHAWATLRRAAEGLGVERHKAGLRGGWAWALPKVLKAGGDEGHRAEGAQAAHSIKTGEHRTAEGAQAAQAATADDEGAQAARRQVAHVSHAGKAGEPALPEFDLPELSELLEFDLPEIDLSELSELLALPEFEPTYPGDLVLIAERLCLDAAGRQALPDGHPGCAFLLAAPGDELSAAEARALGITPAGLARCRG